MPSATAFVSEAPRAQAEPREDMDETRDGSDQSDQWRDAGDDFEHDQPALEPDQFVPRPRLHGLDIFRTRPAQMLQAPTRTIRASEELSRSRSRINRSGAPARA